MRIRPARAQSGRLWAVVTIAIVLFMAVLFVSNYVDTGSEFMSSPHFRTEYEKNVQVDEVQEQLDRIESKVDKLIEIGNKWE